VKYATSIRDGQADIAQTLTGESPTLEVWRGAEPLNCNAPDEGKLIASGVLPKVWLSASHDGTKEKVGDWILVGQKDAGTGSSGTYFRIKQGGACFWQGSFGEGKEMAPKENKIAVGQYVVVKSFTVRRGNA